jgi:glycerol-3-phosphate acyltransferase PlsX
MADHNSIRLAIDVNGGDFGPDVTVAAACEAVATRNHIELILVGTADSDLQALSALSSGQRKRIHFEKADDILDSGVGPVAALRAGNKSTMGRAIELVSSGQAEACISAGSTTALIALGMRMLGTLPGIKRPALMARVPSSNGFTSLLDLGANLNVDAQGLVQFAIMGAVSRAGNDAESCSVGLLNVGHENSKGHSVVKEAHGQLSGMALNYKGFIEGNDIFSGHIDVAVCDGFTGNLVLKSSEGLARLLFSEISQGLKSSLLSRMGAFFARPAMRNRLARFRPEQHNGAVLLGLNGVVVKSHGSANTEATLQAILEASDKAGKQVPEQIQKLMADYGMGATQ